MIYSLDLEELKSCIHYVTYDFEDNTYMSPDGRYLYNGSGDILDEDLNLVGKLKYAYKTLVFRCKEQSYIYSKRQFTLYLRLYNEGSY